MAEKPIFAKCLRGQSLFRFSQSPKLAPQEGRRGQMLDICKQLDNSGQVVDTNTSTDNGQDCGGATRGVFVTDFCIPILSALNRFDLMDWCLLFSKCPVDKNSIKQ